MRQMKAKNYCNVCGFDNVHKRSALNFTLSLNAERLLPFWEELLVDNG